MPMIPDILKSGPRPQAPIFQKNLHLIPVPKPAPASADLPVSEETEWPARIVPTDIYVARKSAFEFLTSLTAPLEIANAAFEELPLQAHGWNAETTTIQHIGRRRWKLRRA